MGAPDLLKRLLAVGVRLWADGDTLIAEPRKALTDELRGLIRENKPELLALLTDRDDRIRCDDCQEAKPGRCLAAARGELPNTAPGAGWISGLRHRCECYKPKPDDPDQRTGLERWPSLRRTLH